MSLCLQKDPSLRPTCAELLQHPWIASITVDTNLYYPKFNEQDRKSWRKSVFESFQQNSARFSPRTSPLAEHRPSFVNDGPIKPISEDWDQEFGFSPSNAPTSVGQVWTGSVSRIDKGALTKEDSLRQIEKEARRRAVEGSNSMVSPTPLNQGNPKDKQIHHIDSSTPLNAPLAPVPIDAFDEAFKGDRRVNYDDEPTSVFGEKDRGRPSYLNRKQRSKKLGQYRESLADADMEHMVQHKKGDELVLELQRSAGEASTSLHNRHESDMGDIRFVLSNSSLIRSNSMVSSASDLVSYSQEGPGSSMTSEHKPQDESSRVRQLSSQDESSRVRQLTLDMVSSQDEAGFVSACEEVVGLFRVSPQLRKGVLTHQGITPLIELLHTSSHLIIESLLRLFIGLVHDDRSFQDLVVMVGLIPAVTRHAGKGSKVSTRKLVGELAKVFILTSNASLHMFVACGGMPILALLLEPVEKDFPDMQLAQLGVEAVQRVFSQSKKAEAKARADQRWNNAVVPPSDYARLFLKTDFLHRVAKCIDYVHLDQGRDACEAAGTSSSRMLSQIGQVLKEFASTHRVVKAHMSSAAILGPTMRGVLVKWREVDQVMDVHEKADCVYPDVFVDIAQVFLGVVKSVVLESNLEADLDYLLPMLVSLLNTSQRKRSNTRYLSANAAMSTTCLVCLFHLTHGSKLRVEKACAAGLIPRLRHAIESKSAVYNLALQMLCDLAHTSDFTRVQLWNESSILFLADLLVSEDMFMEAKALEALSGLCSHSTPLARRDLLNPKALHRIVSLFQKAKGTHFEFVLSTLLEMVNDSCQLAEALSGSGLFLAEVCSRLNHPSAAVKEALLRLLRRVCWSNEVGLRKLVVRHSLLMVLGVVVQGGEQSGRSAAVLLEDLERAI